MKTKLPFCPVAWLFWAACTIGFSCQLQKYEDVDCPTAADFSVVNDGCFGPCEITVDNKTIGDDDLLSYDWNFGDSTTSTEKNPPAHLYKNFGNYFITLKVSMANCDPVEKTIKISIKDTFKDPPVAAFSMDKPVVMVGETVQFTDASTFTDTWHWSFGDNVASELENPGHAFATADTFEVVLIAEGPGGFDTLKQEVRVRPKMWVKTFDLNADQADQETVRCVAEKSDKTFLFAASSGKNVFTANVATATGNLIGTANSFDLPPFQYLTLFNSSKTSDGFVLAGTASFTNATNSTDYDFYGLRLKPDFSTTSNKSIKPATSEGDETANGVAEVGNGSFVFCGNRTGGGGDNGMFFIKTSATLDPSAFKSAFTDNKNNSANAILKASDGYAVVGTKFSGSGAIEGIFFHLNEDLVLDGSHKMLGADFNPSDLLPLPNGFFVAIGSEGLSSRAILLNGSGSPAGFSKVVDNVFLNKAIRTADGHFVVVGRSSIGGKNAGFIAKYDAATGNQIWAHDLTLSGGDREFLCVAQLADNGFLIGGQQLSASGKQEAVLVRTDSEGRTD